MTALIKRYSATQSFIEDAIAGGWRKECGFEFSSMSDDEEDFAVRFKDATEHVTYSVYYLLLDPLAWQAAGKTRGWNRLNGHFDGRRPWHDAWVRFIDILADGKTIDEALAAISQGV